MNNANERIPGPMPAGRAPVWGVAAVAVGIMVCAPGCRPERTGGVADDPQVLPVVAALEAQPGHVVLAQGRLEPAGGVVPVVVAVGDRVESIEVAEGDMVTAGTQLGRLASHRLRVAELEVAEAKLAEAQAGVRAQQSLAGANLAVAEVGIRGDQRRLEEAEEQLAVADREGGQLQLLQSRVALAEEKLAQLRQAATAPDGRRLVTETAVRQQELAVESSRAELREAQRSFEAAIETARLSLEASQAQLEAARLEVQAAVAQAPVESLEKSVELLRLQVQESRLTSPIDGVVLAVDTAPGQPTTGSPLFRVADTSEMLCRAEVPVAELARIAIGAEATIHGGGLEQILRGRVQSISRLVGTPQLPSPNPMTPVDWRSGTVVIAIEESDAASAAQRVHAQVDVAIAAERP